MGLYVHVPFCARPCHFCAFYQEAPHRSDVVRYLDAICGEWNSIDLGGREITTVFWGGGTPGLLAPKDLARLGEIVTARWPGPPQEWTVEMAPSTVTLERLRVLRDLGVTRISIGVQSFDSAVLEAMGRLHTVARVDAAIEAVRQAGFGNLNLDLMFAFPGQTLEAWMADLDEAVSRRPDHLSTYCLTFEEDTELWLRLRRGEIRKMGEEEEAAFYLAGWSRLRDHGFEQYEVSNFSQPGMACVHNLNTWRMHEWIGIGPSASSQYQGWRYTNIGDLEAWAEGVREGRPRYREREAVSPRQLLEDALIFGLRMRQGVDLKALSKRFPGPGVEEIRSLLERSAFGSFLCWEGHHCRLSEEGLMLADQVGSELVGTLGESVIQSGTG